MKVTLLLFLVVVYVDLWQWAAEPLVKFLVEAAGVIIITAGVVITGDHKLRPIVLFFLLLPFFHLLLLQHLHWHPEFLRHHHHGGLFAPHGYEVRLVLAGGAGDVTGGTRGAAVVTVSTADRLIGRRQNRKKRVC